MPPDLSLESRDTLLLYQALKSSPGALSSEEVEQLEPSRYFQSVKRMLRQEDILRYEEALKETVSRLISASGSEESSSVLTTVTDKLSDPKIKRLLDAELNAIPPKRVFLSQLIKLVSDLHAQGDLVRFHLEILKVLTLSDSLRYCLILTAVTARSWHMIYSRDWRKAKNIGEPLPQSGSAKFEHTRAGWQRLSRENVKPTVQRGKKRMKTRLLKELLKAPGKPLSTPTNHLRSSLLPELQRTPKRICRKRSTTWQDGRLRIPKL